jgi:hypothetical protein
LFSFSLSLPLSLSLSLPPSFSLFTSGVVYRARDLVTKEIVAVKKVKMHDQNNMYAGFPLTSIREMNLLLTMRHPNVR